MPMVVVKLWMWMSQFTEGLSNQLLSLNHQWHDSNKQEIANFVGTMYAWDISFST